MTGVVVKAGDREGVLASGLSRELTGRAVSLLAHRTDMSVVRAGNKRKFCVLENSDKKEVCVERR